MVSGTDQLLKVMYESIILVKVISMVMSMTVISMSFIGSILC